MDTEEGGGQYLCVFLPEVVGKASVNVKGELCGPWSPSTLGIGRPHSEDRWAPSPGRGLRPPHTLCFPLGPPKVKAVKKSEHVTEGEGAVLACKSESFPPITEWVWYKVGDTEHQVLTNNSQGKVFVVSTETRTELHILNLDLEADPGQYVCNGSSTEGTGHAVVTLHVRSQLAALWPFLGIVAEVLVLVTVIFIYEKRRKPDEVPDGEPAQPRSGGRRRALWVAGRPPRALPCLSQLGSPPPRPRLHGLSCSVGWGRGTAGSTPGGQRQP